MKTADLSLSVQTPPTRPPQDFMDATAAVTRLCELYEQATRFLCEKFSQQASGPRPEERFRAFYPEIRISPTSYAKADSRLAYGHVAGPGNYATTVTRPDLFSSYLRQQIDLLIASHGVPVTIGVSDTPIPVHFAVANDASVSVPQDGYLKYPLRDIFDVPDLATTNDNIVNGLGVKNPDGSSPLAPFTAQRIDYSLARLSHYTATLPEHFQNLVLFTNYQFYVAEFEAYARKMLADPDSGYTSFVSTGNVEITDPQAEIA
ncbi:MAG: AMP nucleosidase, partial [Halocynthiibacter sp.]